MDCTIATVASTSSAPLIAPRQRRSSKTSQPPRQMRVTVLRLLRRLRIRRSLNCTFLLRFTTKIVQCGHAGRAILSSTCRFLQIPPRRGGCRKTRTQRLVSSPIRIISVRIISVLSDVTILIFPRCIPAAFGRSLNHDVDWYWLVRCANSVA